MTTVGQILDTDKAKVVKEGEEGGGGGRKRGRGRVGCGGIEDRQG